MNRYIALWFALTAMASVLPLARAADAGAPVAPTCAKKVSKQVMSGGVLKTVMVDNGACLKLWDSYSVALTNHQAAQLEAQAAEVRAARAARIAALPGQAAAFRALTPGSDGDSAFGPMKWIPAGEFMFGQGDLYGLYPHSVTLTRGFWLMEHEMTQEDWEILMGNNPSKYAACGPKCPVERISWNDAVAFAQRASARDGVTYTLPTEAQWDWAAKGKPPGANEASIDLSSASLQKLEMYAWYGDNSHPVCGKQRSGYGLCDMAGNVGEFVMDHFCSHTYPYDSSTEIDPLCTYSSTWGDQRVYRNGPNRNSRRPAEAWGDVGFRLARTVP